MKKIIILFLLFCLSANIHAQIKILDDKRRVVDNIISGMTYPNISKDDENNFYLVNSNECKTGNLQVIKLGKKDDALKTFDFFQSFIKDENAGAFIDIQDESTGYKFRLFRVNLMGQGGIRFESLDNQYDCPSVLYIKSIKEAIKIVESTN
ncbi:MAG: hypothetical protein K6B68_05710 [Eubacterium sp.]|jgi:hypothetical protein|nr:hypothetical protein [Eubacterium sp.]